MPLPRSVVCPRRPRMARGVAAVEFALVAGIFCVLLLGIMDFGRWVHALHLGAEVTRLGARVAIVCGLDRTDAVRSWMRTLMPALQDHEIRIDYLGRAAGGSGSWSAGCSFENCEAVRVSLAGVFVRSSTGVLPIRLPVPAFSTTLTRESLGSPALGLSPLCQFRPS